MEMGRIIRKQETKKPTKHQFEKAYIKKLKIRRSISLLQEYTESSTIHGIQHIFREGETWYHCVIWAVLWSLCVSGAVYLAQNRWRNYMNHPLALSITHTQHPLEGLWFPAVAFCPSNKILLDRANEYILRHAKDTKIVNDSTLTDFYKALTVLQHPLYVQMEHFLEKSDYVLPQLAQINITALMYYSMPRCEDIFIACYWKGNLINCCTSIILSLQRSEEGFCYSFNSLTAESMGCNCTYFDAHNENKKGCELEKLENYGPSTGLEVYFKLMDPQKYPSLDFTGGPKLKVQVFHPNEFPEPGMYSLIPMNGNNKLAIGITPTMVKSSEDIKTLDDEVRGCVFKEDITTTKASRTYSQKTCLLECRMAYMMRKCYCLPYYFNRFQNDSAPVCSSVQLQCIINVSSELRFYKPPVGFESYLTSDSNHPLSCQHCKPTCNEVRYEVQTYDLPDHRPGVGDHPESDGYVDVYYKAPGAFMYERDVTYGFIELLVDTGGIGGLFLGGSILSLMEVLYWFSKAGISFWWPANKLSYKQMRAKQTITRE